MTVETPERLRGTIWDRLDLTERAIEFRDSLLVVEQATEEMLREQIALLPAGIATHLERGPTPRRYECAVCNAFGRDWVKEVPCDPADPLWRVWAFHETPKLDARHKDDQHYGAIANRIYERTLATYRAAGWQGVATPPDA